MVKRLSPGGVFVFTIEAEEGDSFKFNKTGRYSHSIPYVVAAGKQSSCEVVIQQECVLRYEYGQPVKGIVFGLAAK